MFFATCLRQRALVSVMWLPCSASSLVRTAQHSLRLRTSLSARIVHTPSAYRVSRDFCWRADCLWNYQFFLVRGKPQMTPKLYCQVRLISCCIILVYYVSTLRYVLFATLCGNWPFEICHTTVFIIYHQGLKSGDPQNQILTKWSFCTQTLQSYHNRSQEWPKVTRGRKS